jgi:WD40 repeat protein
MFATLRFSALLIAVAALQASSAPQGGAGATDPKPGFDVVGDPLPAGAIARCGTTRFRHNGGASKAAFFKDGKMLATVGGDATIHLWEFPSGKFVRKLAGHKYTLHDVAIATDGKTLFAADGQTILSWDIDSGKVVGRFAGDAKGASPLAISPDGKWLAHVVEPNSSRVRICEAQTGKEVHLLPEAKSSISGLVFSPDSRTLAVVGHIRGVEIWEVATGKLRETYAKLRGQATAAVFTPDSKSLIVGASKGLHVFQLISGEEMRQFGPDQLWPGSLAVSSDNKMLAVPLSGGEVALWDLTTGREVRRWPTDHFGGASRVAFSPDDKVLLTTAGHAGNARHIGLWDVSTGKAMHPQIGHNATITGIALSRDGKSLASTSWDGTLRLWDPATGLQRKQIKAEASKPFHCVAFAPDGKTLVTGAQKGLDDLLLQMWDAESCKELFRFGRGLRRFGKTPGVLYSVAFSPDGKTLAACGSSDTISLWDPKTGQPKGQLVAEGAGWMSSLAFSPDGKKLVSGHALRHASVWDLATGTELYKLKHGGTVRAVAFSTDSQMVATAAADDSARLWQADNGTELARCLGHNGHAMAVALSPNGKLMVTAGLRGRGIRLWDVASGLGLVEFGGDEAFYTALAFSPDSKTLISAGSNYCLTVWDVAKVLEKYKPAVTPLTAKELETLWSDLASGDAAVAFKAMRALAGAPMQTVPFLQKKMDLPTPSKELSLLIAELDAKDFAAREKATAEVLKLGKTAVPVLQRILDETDSQEVRIRLSYILQKMGVEPLPPSYALRELRAVEILEVIGGKEARKTLEAWVAAYPASRLAREAKAALNRLSK